MTRSKTHAHLYDRAERGSRRLLRRFAAEKTPFEEPLQRAYGVSQVQIRDSSEAIRCEEVSRHQAESSCSCLVPLDSLPALLQACHELYYGSADRDRAWLGIAIKLALAHIWQNVHERDREITPTSQAQLERAVIDMAVWDQTRSIRAAFETLGGEGTIGFGGAGLRLSGTAGRFGQEITRAVGRRSRFYRTIDDSAHAIVLRAHLALEGIDQILRGAREPSACSAFKDSIFTEIPVETREFWAGLWARLHMLAIASESRRRYRRDFEGIAILGPTGIVGSGMHGIVLLQQSVQDLFWTKRWYAARIREDARNMIVERPVLRLIPDSELFLTSVSNIVDSITWFVEASILDYKGFGGAPLPAEIFERMVSKPFEDEVRELFAENGYVVGSVTDRGTWVSNQYPRAISHPSGAKCPGQIDVVAYHPVFNLVVVGECKVIADPTSFSRLRNVVSKFGSSDAEGFHRKIRKKIQWISQTDAFPSVSAERFIGLLITDEPVATTDRPEHPVVDLERLRKHLRTLNDRWRQC